MEYQYFQVDAFASEIFRGNPAGVVPMESWPDDALLQSMASEHNLSETAFFVAGGDDGADFALRWMTPTSEVDLCGHATLAAAHVLWEHLGWKRDSIDFSSRSGRLAVRRDGGLYEMDFPSLPLERVEVGGDLVEALGARPAEVWRGMDLVCVFDDERDVLGLAPDFGVLKRVPGVRAVAATARASEHDFMSRLFAPAVGIDEDPVTGSLHSMLAPLWAERLGTNTLNAFQASKRGGEIRCVVDGDRVRLAGSAVTYLDGVIRL